jgi:rhodanese-related sulfurtransferase
MSPASLRTKLDGDQDIAIIDLLNFEDEDAIIGIPGAIRIDPKRLRSRSRVIMPKALEVILYSSSQREITSARVALALRRKGIPRVWILEGGLKAWIKQGFPVTANLTSQQERIARLGIQILDQDAEPESLL